LRGIRVGTQPSVVGVHVRAAIASWQNGTDVLGGVALLGCQPAGCTEPVDAVIVLPRAVLVVVGVDLPEPAMQLYAPLDGTWKVDGWPLVRPDGPLNPASEGLKNAAAVIAALRAAHAEALNIHAVVAVGPYAASVSQPSTRSCMHVDTNTVVLHPEANALLATAKAAQGSARPLSVEDARALLRALAPQQPTPRTTDLDAEGFPDVVTAEVATAETNQIPKVLVPPPPMPPPLGSKPLGGNPQGSNPQGSNKPLGNKKEQPKQGKKEQQGKKAKRDKGASQLRWLPVTAASMLCVLMVTGILMAITSTAQPGSQSAAAERTGRLPSSSTAVRPAGVAVDGIRFTAMATSTAQDCAQHAFGAVRTLLSGHACTELMRSAYRTSQNGNQAAVSVAQLRFADAGTARKFAAGVNKPESGGITDLVSEGRGWDGGPQTFDGAAFAVAANGSEVRMTSAVWAQQQSKPDDPGLRQLAQRALRLPM
jgi:hypothetical protein